MAFTVNTLSEQLVHAYMASRLEEAHSRRTTARGAPRAQARRRRTGNPDPYFHYLIAREAENR